MSVKVGDWVAFYRNAELILGRVLYVRDNKVFPYGLEALTDAGAVNVTDVLESRSPAPVAANPQEK